MTNTDNGKGSIQVRTWIHMRFFIYKGITGTSQGQIFMVSDNHDTTEIYYIQRYHS